MRKSPVLFRLIVAVPTCLGLSAMTFAQQATLINGGDVMVRRDGSILHVSIVGPRAGLASLCVGDATQVRILHASAAVGDALFEKADSGWKLKHGFEWRLRDAAPGSTSAAASAPASASADDPEAYFAEKGWVANANRGGSAPRNFRIRVTDRTQYLGVTFLAVGEPMTVSYWPATLDDDCRQMKIGQGHLPEVAQFKPETWTRVQP
jgi:hypothetical protein